MKKVLLVYPRVPGNTYWSYKHALKFVRKKSAMPPLGLITVASFFPRNYELKLVDMNIEPLRPEALQWADGIFISAMIVQKSSFMEIVEICNRYGKMIVAGGPFPTSSWREISGVDHFVLGEVEESLADFVEDWERGTLKQRYRASRLPDISRPNVPRFDLLNLSAYSSMSIQYSRGCPFRCEFCDIWKVYGNRPRIKSSQAVLAELDALKTAGWRGPVFIVDDNFIGNKGKVKNVLLPALEKWQKAHRYPFRFFTEASINLGDDPVLLKAMRNAGFNEVFIGIETPSRECLQETGKYQNLKSNLADAIREIQAYGIEVMAGFILGFDSDSEDIFERQIHFIQKAGIPQAMVGLLNALPGTDLYRRLEKENRLLSESAGNNTHSMATNFRTRMESEQLKKGYRKVLATLYDPNLKNYFKRCSRLLDRLGKTDYPSREIHAAEVVTLIKSICRQPFTRYGFQYAKFLIRNMVKHRHYFPEAVKYGIVGHHFHKITREMLKADRMIRSMDAEYDQLKDQLSRYMDHSRETLGQVIELWRKKTRVLRKIRDGIRNVDADFRIDIAAKYYEIAFRMQALFNRYRQDLLRQGIFV